jgi:uncharacterized phage-associated protein
MPLKFTPKLNKVVEILLYLAHKCPGIDKYQASKFFYLADREHLSRYGRPISFEPYFALWYGPVPTHALDLLEHDPRVMQQAGIKELPFETEVGNANGSKTVFIRKPKRAPDYDLFSKTDLKVLDEIIETYGKSSFKELMDLTHEHTAYKAAWEDRRHEGAKRAEMYWDEFIEDEERRKAFVRDIAPVSARM